MKYLVIFGFLTISNAFESPFWTWILVSHLSRGCLPVSLDYVKCRQYFGYEKIRNFQPTKNICLTKLMPKYVQLRG